MRGVRRQVAAYLDANLPARRVELESRGILIPKVELVAATDRSRLEPSDYPAVLVTPRKTLSLHREDLDGLGETFEGRYLIAVYVFVRGDDHDETGQRRDDLTLAVRELLLRFPKMGDTSNTYTFEPDTLTEDYSDVATLRRRRGEERVRVLAGAFLEGVVRTSERLDLFPVEPVVPDVAHVEITVTQPIP